MSTATPQDSTALSESSETDLPEDFPVKKMEHHPYYFEPENFEPLNAQQEQKVFYAATMAFSLLCFGATGSIISLSIWWLPLRPEYQVHLLRGTAWPGMITIFCGVCFAIGAWLMVQTYKYAEKKFENTALASEEAPVEAVAQKQLKAIGGNFESAAPAALPEPNQKSKDINEDKKEVDTICTLTKSCALDFDVIFCSQLRISNFFRQNQMSKVEK